MLKLLFRIVAVVGLMVVALALVFAAIIGIDSIGAESRLAAVTNTSIPIGDGQEIRAYVARPGTPGPHPVIIVLHEFWGLRHDMIGKADDLAARGYLVVAPNIFRGRTTSSMPGAIYNLMITPLAQQLSDIDAVYEWMRTQPDAQSDRIVVMGFSYGGQMALDYSIRYAKGAAVITFYGILDERYPLRFDTLPGPVLGVFAGADQSILLSGVRRFEGELNAAGVVNEITIYEGEQQAFVTTIEAIRAGGAQGRAWAQLLSFLERHVQPAQAAQSRGMPRR